MYITHDLFSTDYTESIAAYVVRDAVQLVLMDKGFKIPSSSAKTAVETAEKLLEWCSQAKNKEVFGQFATDLLQELHG